MAAAIASRAVLPDEAAARIDLQRQRLRELHLRALDCLSDGWRLSNVPTLARQAAADDVPLDPLHERSYR